MALLPDTSAGGVGNGLNKKMPEEGLSLAVALKVCDKVCGVCGLAWDADGEAKARDDPKTELVKAGYSN